MALTVRGHRGATSPLPPGALTVGAGLLVSGICTYAFLAITGHTLTPERYSAFAGFWAVLFVVAPGVFLPLEQELGRAIAARRARSAGSGPVLRRCALIGGAFLAALLLVGGLGFVSIDAHLLGADTVLMAALLLGLTAYCAEHIARGTLGGSGRFGAYGLLLGAEGIFRVLFCAVLAALHVRTPGPYGLAVVVASFAAVAAAIAGQRGLNAPGPPSASTEVTAALGSLLLASLATQFMFNGGTVVVQLLAPPGERRAAGTFLNGRVLAFIPLFLFQAVTAALLPRLSALHSSDAQSEFRRTLVRLLLLVGVLGALSISGAFALGPLALRLVFGPAFRLTRVDLAILAAGCTALMTAQALGQGLIARCRFGAVVAGWMCGVAVFFGLVFALHPLLLRVEVALAGGGLAAAVVLGALQPTLWRRAGLRDA